MIHNAVRDMVLDNYGNKVWNRLLDVVQKPIKVQELNKVLENVLL